MFICFENFEYFQETFNLLQEKEAYNFSKNELYHRYSLPQFFFKPCGKILDNCTLGLTIN